MIIEKDIRLFSVADVEALVAERVMENDRIEFKGSLCFKGKGVEPWLAGEDTLTDDARNAILDEIITFANTNGGYLFLGVQESNSEPHYASSITPLPRGAKLLERIMRSATDCIDPKLNCLESHFIEIDADGSGVLLFHTIRSMTSPHRLATTRECYIRDGEQTRKMSMLEIQTATLRTNRHVVEGLWTGIFHIQPNFDVGFVIVLEMGRLFGGDSCFYYEGRYEVINGDELHAIVRVRHYAGPRDTIFGDKADIYTVSIRGKHSAGKISCSFSRDDMPGVVKKADIARRENLP